MYCVCEIETLKKALKEIYMENHESPTQTLTPFHCSRLTDCRNKLNKRVEKLPEDD